MRKSTDCYGGKPAFLQELDARGQRFVAEVPRTYMVRKERPPVVEEDPPRPGPGRRRKTPRIADDVPPATSVAALLEAPALASKRWIRYRVKEGRKGPVVWEAKRIEATLKASDGLPGMRLQLIVAHNSLDRDELKFFVSNAPPQTSVARLLPVAFSRRRVERRFQDPKQEIGLDQWEGRTWIGLHRHLILSCVSYLFLARCRERLRGKKPAGHDLPGADRAGRAAAELLA